MSATTEEKSFSDLLSELEHYRQRAEDAEEVIRAIRAGEIDALVVSSPEGDQVFSLAGAERPYRLMIEEMNEGALSTTADGTILYCNRRFAQMVELPMDHITGSKLSGYLVQDEVDTDRALQRDEWPYRVDVLLRGPRAFIPVTMSINRVREADNESLCVVISDLRERKWAEIELARQTAEINLRKAMETQLAMKATELEESVKQLESFSYSVSHDLRAPLRSIHGFSSILVNDFSDKMPEGSHRLIDMIRESCLRMDELITDLLKFAKLSQQAVSGQQIDLGSIAHEIFDEACCMGRGSHAKFTVEADLTCYADAALMRQVLTNLISNACKFSRKSPDSHIHFGAKRSGEECVFYIQDNGVGFNPKYADKLFLVFQRLHRQEDFEGTGVGLAIVKGIISKHNGRIWAESAVGKGTTFYFTLNLEAINPPAEAAQTNVTPLRNAAII